MLKGNTMHYMDKNNSDFRKLKSLIFEGNYSEIDNLFKKMSLSEKDEDDLILRMLNDTFLFSFRAYSTDIQQVKQERLNREIAVLKNFRIENQLKLFNISAIEELNHKHLEVIELSNNNKEIIKNSSNMIYAITDIFNNENFEELDKIFNILPINLLENKINGVVFHRKENGSTGSSYFKLNENLFSPKFNIVSIYSDKKKEYLLKKNIALPTIEEVDYLKLKIIEYMNTNQYFRQDDINNVEIAYSNYITQKSYLDLNNELKKNNFSNKKPKI